MIINNESTTGACQTNLDRTTDARPVSNGGGLGASGGSSQTSDSITLSQSRDLVQLALSSGSADRETRIQQLKQLVQTNQYQVDAGTLSNALIDAHLAGA